APHPLRDTLVKAITGAAKHLQPKQQ
ncbi:MAG: hypothetical protein RIR45_451, partial [Pseudomonadota bacterium]